MRLVDQFHAYYKTRFLGCDDVPLPNGKTLEAVWYEHEA